LAQVRRADLGRVGGKGVNLGEALGAGLSVPEGFAVTTAAFDQFLCACPERTQVLALLASTRDGEIPRSIEVSNQVNSCLRQVEVPPGVIGAVLEARTKLPKKCGLAVRSSATVEDAPDQSFAGQFESILNVSDAEELLRALRACWLSLYSERALVYLSRLRVPVEKIKMAVVVQEMVDAEWSGVVFTADPITGARNRMIVEYVPGVGDALVQGMAQPRRWVIDKQTRRWTEPRTGLLSPAASLRQDVVDCALRCEALFAAPQDVEWASREDKVYLLQSRPITNLSQPRTWEARQVWTNLNTGEVMPDVTTPMSWSLIQQLVGPLFRSLARLAAVDLSGCTPIGLVAGRVYVNVNTCLAAVRPFSFIVNRAPYVAQALGGGQVALSREILSGISDEDLPDVGFRWLKFVLSWPGTLVELYRHSPRRGDAWIGRLELQADALERIDLEGMATTDLTRFIVNSFQDSFAGWDLLYLGTQAWALPVFEHACRNWLNDPALTSGYRLFSGLGGVPEAEAGLALWGLAALAHGDEQNRLAVGGEGAWNEVQARLQQTEPGREFIAAWKAFMTEHGHHCRGELELFNARWSETPDYILGLVRGYLRSIAVLTPRENQSRLAVEREQLTEQCRRQIRNPIKRWLFLRSLRRAQKLSVNRERWKNAAVRQIAILRRALLILGRILQVRETLSEPNDIFFLQISELTAVTNGDVGFDPQERIRSRRVEYETNLEHNPPTTVAGRFTPAKRASAKSRSKESVLQGIAVSPGMATGRAKVVLRHDPEAQVLSGEILIAPFTDPAWTPYFIAAAAVVMEKGGMLSHGSIVAREYGLPAVTNIEGATRVIHTGDLVQVDGNCGLVTILESGTAGELAK
jgi:pyruvate,water dikinase